MLKVIKDMLRFDTRFRIAFILLSLVVIMVLMSLVSPLAPDETFEVDSDPQAQAECPFGTRAAGTGRLRRSTAAPSWPS